jgi:hypothetical protein
MICKSPADVRIVILNFDSEEMSAEAKRFAPNAVTFIEFQIWMRHRIGTVFLLWNM